MKLKTLFSGIVLLLVAQLSPGQVTEKQFVKAVDYLNCRLSLFSLAKNPKFSSQASDFSKLCPCEMATSKQVVEALTQLKVNETLKMATELASVPQKEGHRLVGESKLETILDYLTKGIYEDSVKVVSEKKPKYSSVAKFKSKLKLEELTDLQEKIKAILTPPPPGDKPSWPSWLPSVLGTLLGLLAGAGLTFLYFRGREKELRRSGNKNPYDDFNRMQGQAAMNQAMDDPRRLDQLENDLRTKDTEIARLKAALNPPPSLETKPEPPAAVASSTGGSERYFSIPDLDERQRGFWFDDNGSDGYRPHVSTYRLALSGDRQSARFEVANAPEAMNKLIGSRVSGVLPVCTELTAYSPEARRISTKTPGKARREGDRWVVTEPAQIEYA